MVNNNIKIIIKNNLKQKIYLKSYGTVSEVLSANKKQFSDIFSILKFHTKYKSLGISYTMYSIEYYISIEECIHNKIVTKNKNFLIIKLFMKREK